MSENTAAVCESILRKKRDQTGNIRKDGKARKNSGQPYKQPRFFVPGKKGPSQVCCLT